MPETLENQTAKLERIPRGNTCPGVNREIIEILLKREFAPSTLLDVPCGAGDFLRTVKDFFPVCKTFGADIRPPEKDFPGKFMQIDAQSDDLFELTEKPDAITCISGVMEFDNTLAFFEKLHENLNENGVLIVTNDNLVSVRDRFLYLLFGRFRQYRRFIEHEQPTWKMLHLQNLLRILNDANFEKVEIRYAPIVSGDLIWLPFALILYVFQLMYFHFAETETPSAEKSALYPFNALLSRHYVVVCRVDN